jgi:hypothetical protein
MAGLPDPPRRKTEPTKAFKNGCLAALFWGLVVTVPVAVIVYAVTVWLSERAAETRQEPNPPSAAQIERAQGSEGNGQSETTSPTPPPTP